MPELNDKQLEKLSDFFSNLSLLVIASLVLPNIFGVEKLNFIELLLGVILTIVLLLISMIVIRRV